MPTRKAQSDCPLHFPDWAAALAVAELSAAQRAAYAATLRWYLSFCRRGRS